MGLMKMTQVTESEFQAAVAKLKFADRAIIAAMDADNAGQFAHGADYQSAVAPHLADAESAKSVIDAYWAGAPEGFISRQLLQQPDI